MVVVVVLEYASLLTAFVSIPDSIFQLFQNLDDSFVMASARDYTDWRAALHISDLVSAEIPLSMKHRCLRYQYLILGRGPALVVAYIKNYFRPYDLSNYLNVHGRSSVIKFRSATANLPVGIKFKVRVLQIRQSAISFFISRSMKEF